MKKLKDITVEVKFRVGYSGIEVPDNIYKGLCSICYNHGSFSDTDANMCNDADMAAAFEWLNDNMKADDAFDIEYEIEYLIDNENE